MLKQIKQPSCILRVVLTCNTPHSIKHWVMTEMYVYSLKRILKHIRRRRLKFVWLFFKEQEVTHFLFG